MDINYELYKVFYYVASTLSFSEASKQLFISQSAVSQSIKALEKKLDQTLFIRSTKKVRLTTEGEILLRHIEPAISLIKRGESQLLDVGVRGGQLHIGASDTICRYFLVPSGSAYQGYECDIDPLRRTPGDRAGGSDRCQFTEFLSRKCSECEKDQRFPGCVHCQ